MSEAQIAKTAYVTGGSSGLGLASAIGLSEAGWNVAILDLKASRGKDAVAARTWTGPTPAVVHCDTGSPESVERAFSAAAELVGQPDALVNNAGVREVAPFLELRASEWERVIQVNLTGYFLCAQGAASAMAENGGGSIVNVSSCAGLAAVPGRPAYNSSKAGVIGLTRTMAAELGPRNIRTNAICPSIILTPLTQGYFDDEGFAEGIRQAIPNGRPGNADEVADLVVYLLSERSTYVNGAIVSIDGGFLAAKGFESGTGGETNFSRARGVV